MGDTDGSTATTTTRSPLHDRHVAAGARMVPFAGWLMPLEYAGGGVLAEHGAVRAAVGLFDVSHLGTLLVRGAGSVAVLDSLLTADMGALAPGAAQYTLLCRDDGGVVDDLIAYRLGPDEVLLVPNAANADVVLREVRAAARAAGSDGTVVVENLHTDRALLAVQGPRSTQVMAEVGLPHEMPYMHLQRTDGRAEPSGAVLVCRTGYTGEHGYEVVVSSAQAAALWDRLAAAVSEHAGRLCGLGARDTLRTEMGYPLHGQDLSQQITPVQARLGWAVGWDKPVFRGRSALIAERSRGPSRRLLGLLCQDRGVPRPGMPVRDQAGRELGYLTSGTFSPTLRTGIALALLTTGPHAPQEGDEVLVDIRGRTCRASVVRPPFVESHVR